MSRGSIKLGVISEKATVYDLHFGGRVFELHINIFCGLRNDDLLIFSCCSIYYDCSNILLFVYVVHVYLHQTLSVALSFAGLFNYSLEHELTSTVTINVT